MSGAASELGLRRWLAQTFKDYLPSKKNNMSQAIRQELFQALMPSLTLPWEITLMLKLILHKVF